MYQDLMELEMESGEIENVTSRVEDIVSESGVGDGLCLVYSLGSTCSVFINEDDPMLLEDLKEMLEEVAPEEDIYHHPDNAHSHLRTMLLGESEAVPVREGALHLGTWQSVLVANWDTKDREREVIVTVYPG